MTAPALDEAVEAGRHLPGQWFLAGVAQVLIPVVVTTVVGAVLLLTSLPQTPDTVQVYAAVAALATGLVVYLSVERIAELHGGWRAAFGVAPPALRDVPTVVCWLAVQLVARLAVMTVVVAQTPGLTLSYGGGSLGLTRPGTLMLVMGAALLGPAAEELAFRGVVLRGLMRRMSFWPAALASSLVFALLHLAGAARLATVPLLLLTVMAFAVLQCVLVRRTGRLGPAIAVHGLLNLVVVGLALGAV